MTPRNIITLENSKSYATEANLHKALKKYGFDEYREHENCTPCRFIIAKTPDNRWTAIFLLSEHFNSNATGGYVGVFSEKGFMTI